jgi:hypothetical protein
MTVRGYGNGRPPCPDAAPQSGRGLVDLTGQCKAAFQACPQERFDAIVPMAPFGAFCSMPPSGMPPESEGRAHGIRCSWDSTFMGCRMDCPGHRAQAIKTMGCTRPWDAQDHAMHGRPWSSSSSGPPHVLVQMAARPVVPGLPGASRSNCPEHPTQSLLRAMPTCPSATRHLGTRRHSSLRPTPQPLRGNTHGDDHLRVTTHDGCPHTTVSPWAVPHRRNGQDKKTLRGPGP